VRQLVEQNLTSKGRTGLSALLKAALEVLNREDVGNVKIRQFLESLFRYDTPGTENVYYGFHPAEHMYPWWAKHMHRHKNMEGTVNWYGCDIETPVSTLNEHLRRPSSDCQVALARGFLVQRRHNEAFEVLEKAIQSNPRNQEYWRGLYEAGMSSHNHKLALDSLHNLVAMNPTGSPHLLGALAEFDVFFGESPLQASEAEEFADCFGELLMEFGEIRHGVQNSAELWESIFDTYMTLGKHCQARFALKCLRRVDGFTPSFQEQAFFRMVEKALRTHNLRPDNEALLRYSILIICSHELAHYSDSGVEFATTRDRIPWHVTRLLYDRVILAIHPDSRVIRIIKEYNMDYLAAGGKTFDSQY